MNTLNKILVCLIVILCNHQVRASQIDTIVPADGKTKIYLMDGRVLQGKPLLVTDSSLAWQNDEDSAGFNEIKFIPAEQVQKIVWRDHSKFTVLQGAAFGMVGGFLLGFLLGLNDCSDGDCKWYESVFANSSFQNSVKIGIGFSLIGMGIGIFTGGKARIKIGIGGSRKKFNRQKNRIPIY